MKIVVALDKFKGSLTATEACGIVRDAIRGAQPGWEVVTAPMADGGDGTAEVLHSALGGEWISKQVTGPLATIPSTARYLRIPERELAAVEMAAASGLALLKTEERDPLRTTTFGTGELIRASVERGAKRVWLCAGGSATVDGGVGAAMALGWKFLDKDGEPIGFGGGELERIVKLEAPRRVWPEVDVLCDAVNPLCGGAGAARVFGPQKGATPEMVERLETGLRRLARLVFEQLGKDVLDLPGGGAAGGLAAGAVAFMDAKIVSGVDAVMEATGLERTLAGADWVITGEGRFDEQSLRGKVVAGVTKLASRQGTKVAVLAGSIALPAWVYQEAGVALALAAHPPGVATETAMSHAWEYLGEAARRLAGKLMAVTS